MSSEHRHEPEVVTQTNVEEVVPFFRVADMETSLSFYVQGLGFEVALKWIPDGKIRWCRLQLGGAALMLQEYRKAPVGRVGEGVSVCFTCKDALAIHRQAKQNSLSPQEPFVGNGLWVTCFTDPDGYRIEFASPTDLPEETTLSQWEAGNSPK
jgi:lactoylglutathione lyase